MTETKGFLDKLGEIAAEKIIPKLVELLWPRMERFLLDVILPKVLATIPLAAAAATKAAIDNIPGIEMVKDVVEIADDVRDRVNVAIPDVDIPILSDIFDLTEFLGGK